MILIPSPGVSRLRDFFNVRRSVAASFAVIAFAAFATIGSGASAAETPIDGANAFAGPNAHFTLLSTDGQVLGELVADGPGQLRLRPIGNTRTAPAGIAARADRTFRPDYSHALSSDQMAAAWQAELDRLFPPAISGGG